MSAQPDQWSREGALYRAATVSTDDHSRSCPACAGGGSCGDADDLMDAEYRRIEQWRQVDPARADGYDRATWPTT